LLHWRSSQFDRLGGKANRQHSLFGQDTAFPMTQGGHGCVKPLKLT
jgi:hypothetical protein